ncbi:MAG TPA: hypothetical protein VEI73_04110 [Candidatus Acidoferrum sp.]|nr:hypothetical protein [Candidatus Acidoferrum sp.]
MRTISSILKVILVVLLASTVGSAQQSSKSLTNQDVISMVKSMLPESVILSAIKTNDDDFDVSANGLIALKKAGVTAKIMEAMLDATNNKKNAAAAPVQVAPNAVAGVPNAASFANGGAAMGAGVAPAMATPAGQPAVFVLQGNNKVNLTAQATEIVQTKSKATTLSALAADQALTQALNAGTQVAQQAIAKTGSTMALAALNPGAALVSGLLSQHAKQAKVTFVWALTGGSSNANTDGTSPTFDVNYGGIPGVNADQFEPVIVKLSDTPQGNYRLVGATEAKTTAEQSTQQDWPVYSSFIEDRVDSKVQKIASGHAQLTPSAALGPGEYAVALRPTDKAHKFSGEEVGKNQGEGLLFNYAWAFTVK